jgi:hypothetical protein
MSATLVPASSQQLKQRQSLLNKMTAPVKELAGKLLDLREKVTKNMMLYHYTMGTHARNISNDATKYGANQIELLAGYLAVPGGSNKLYALKLLTETFTWEYVLAKNALPMSNGGFLTLEHWHQLAKLADQEAREACLQSVLERSLTSADMEREIRANQMGDLRRPNQRRGGRNPKAPSSVAAGLQKINELTNRVVRYTSTAAAKVFDPLDALDSEQANKSVLKKMESVLVTVAAAVTQTTTMQERLTGAIEHVREVLTQSEAAAEEAKNAAATKAEETKTAEAEPVAATKPAAAKPSTNGKATAKKKKAKKAKKAAVAA